MADKAIDKKEINLPEDLAKRFNEASDDKERLAVLTEFAQRKGAANAAEKAAAYMSDDQFSTFLERVGKVSADTAKAAIKEMSEQVEQRYQLDPAQAKEIAERSFFKAEDALTHRRSDMENAAQVFRGMWLAKQGKPDEYRKAIEVENAYYQKRFGKQTRAMSNTTDSTGGYLAPQLFSDMLYEQIARTSLVRKFATIIPMKANEIINIPTMTTGLSAGVVAEATAVDGVQPVFSQKQLTTKKIITKTNPISVELIEKAHPAIIQLLLNHAMIEILKAEDSLVFGTSGDGIRASSTNLVSIGSVATSSTDYSSVDYDSMIAMESGLDPQYLIGEDIQGSGIITGAPRYWLPHAMKQELKSKKDGTGRYLDETRDLRNDSEIFGYGVSRVLSLPNGSSLSAGDKVAVFGNLAHVWCGVEPGYRVLIADQGVTDNAAGADINLFDTAQVAIRVLEFFNSVVIDEEAFAIGQMGA